MRSQGGLRCVELLLSVLSAAMIAGSIVALAALVAALVTELVTGSVTIGALRCTCFFCPSLMALKPCGVVNLLPLRVRLSGLFLSVLKMRVLKAICVNFDSWAW